MGDFTMLILQKYSFKVCVILFFKNSTHYKVYTHLPTINTQRRTKSQFDITPVISSSDRQTKRLYQRSADRCEEDRNAYIIRLL